MTQGFAIFFLVIGLIAQGQKDPVRGKQFKLTGRITGKINLTAHCGLIAFATVLEFDVISITGLSYKNKKIGIIITCPRDYEKDFFERDKTYQVLFSDTNQADFGWSILNKDLLKANNLLFDPYAISVKKRNNLSETSTAGVTRKYAE